MGRRWRSSIAEVCNFILSFAPFSPDSGSEDGTEAMSGAFAGMAAAGEWNGTT